MNVWKFISGYVNIEVSGKNLERVVNRATSEGIPLTNAYRVSGRAIIADVAMKDLKRLRIAVRGCGCRIRIKSKHGLPKMGFAARRNALICVCAALALLVLAAASTRVWRIDVSGIGADDVSVLRVLESSGITIGSAKNDIHPADVSKLIIDGDPSVAHANVTLSGVVLSVEVTLSKGVDVEAEDTRPASIYADRDCVITSVSVIRGVAMVRVGDAVRKGQLLISGDLSQIKEGYVVHAEGEITGVALYRVTGDANMVTQSCLRSGRKTTMTAISVFGRDIIPGSPYPQYELEYQSAGMIDASAIPIHVYTVVFYELTEQQYLDTAEGAEERAMLNAQESLSQTIPQSARILTVSHRFVWDCMNVSAFITVETLETIGVIMYL